MHDEEQYQRLRPRLAIARAQAWNFQQTIYLNPALAQGSRGGMARMLETGTLAIVQGVGYDNPNLSHFRSTDIWLSGINDSNPNVRLETGWAGRWLERRYPGFPASLPEHPLGIQFGGFSLALRGSKGRMGIEVTDPGSLRSMTPQLDTLDQQSSGTAYELEYDFVADIAKRSDKYAEVVRGAHSSGRVRLHGAYGDSAFEQQMGSVAALIAGGLKSRVYVVSMTGFDTHFTQQSSVSSGTHPGLLTRLSNGIAEFMFDMTRLGFADRIVGLTVSEFGRRPEENGSFGTDHGASSVQFVFGTQVNSGVFGIAPNLRDLNANGDLYHQIDYREIYAEILTDWFGLSLNEMREVLQDDSLLPLDVLQSQSSGAGVHAHVEVSLGSHPNPFAGSTTLELRLPRAAHARLEISTIQGRRIATPLDRWIEGGVHRIPFAEDLPAGIYICTLRAGAYTATHTLRCVR